MANFLNRMFQLPPAAGVGRTPGNPNPMEDKGLYILTRMMIMGVLAILFVSFYGRSVKQFIPVLGLSAAVGLVSAAVGGLLGFLFGIPISKGTGPAATTGSAVQVPKKDGAPAPAGDMNKDQVVTAQVDDFMGITRILNRSRIG